MRRLLAGVAALLCMGAAPPTGVDPLSARIDVSAVERFATMWKATGGKPTAAQIQADYLATGGRGIEVFTPGRIESADNLARTIAAKPQLYVDAINRCLPWVNGLNADLRATYLALRGLLPNRPLPQIALVFGADNSGGTAQPGIQVIGLEVLCRISPDRAAFEQSMRQFFAHETVHTFQAPVPGGDMSDLMLIVALQEGVPDYISMLVTGRMPAPARDQWARAREATIWKEFEADRAKVRAGTSAKGEPNEEAGRTLRRWFGNAGSPPPGWPDELGYWVGMKIAEGYMAKAPDPYSALDRLIERRDPAAILLASGYGAPAPK